VAITTEKHLSLASKTQTPLSLLLDPQDRRTSNHPAQPLPESKQEEGPSKDATFKLVNGLSNRLVQIERKLQNQLVISQPKPINQRRPYQYPKRNEEPKTPAQAPETNYIDYASPPLYCRACKLPHGESSCAIFDQTYHMYEQEREESSGTPDNTLNMVAEFETIEDFDAFLASNVTRDKPHSAFQIPHEQWKALQPQFQPLSS
jgi:hypothetical protein